MPATFAISLPEPPPTPGPMVPDRVRFFIVGIGQHPKTLEADTLEEAAERWAELGTSVSTVYCRATWLDEDGAADERTSTYDAGGKGWSLWQ